MSTFGVGHVDVHDSIAELVSVACAAAISAAVGVEASHRMYWS
jgi:hypothetical protein